MAEWESSYGGMFLHNAHLLTKEEIQERYPPESNSFAARLTREFVEKGYDILYGENPNVSIVDELLGPGHNWSSDILVTAAHIYNTSPDRIMTAAWTDMSKVKAIYAAVRCR